MHIVRGEKKRKTYKILDGRGEKKHDRMRMPERGTSGKEDNYDMERLPYMVYTDTVYGKIME